MFFPTPEVSRIDTQITRDSEYCFLIQSTGMKACSMFLSAVILACSFAAAQTKPTENGIYVQNGDHWDKLYIASTSGARSSGAAKSAFSYGIASSKAVLVFRDSTAPVKSSSMRPIFLVIGDTITAPRDIVIVRLQQKKDHRELQIGKFNAYSGMKMEYPPADVIEVDVKESERARTITPKTDLKAGEYIIFTGTPTPMPIGYGGYDFSVVSPK